ncbi:hypothetical protein [Streptomyces tremellae]|uniref:Uncharacterized protein n=1 Tax=Streptomyces tremellae TaxID=1124239 RepID=A0ABP7EE63_9ACTN
MNTDVLALLVGLGPFGLAVLAVQARRALQPTGAHRAPRPAPASPYPDSEPTARAWCPECARTEAHALHLDGTRTCWTCHTTTQGDM